MVFAAGAVPDGLGQLAEPVISTSGCDHRRRPGGAQVELLLAPITIRRGLLRSGPKREWLQLF